MKHFLQILIACLTLSSLNVACRDDAADETSSLQSIDFQRQFLIRGRSGKLYTQRVLSVTGDRNVYPYCPGNAAADLGTTVVRPGNVLSTADRTHYFLWMQNSNQGYNASAFICGVVPFTRAQYFRSRGCSCVRAYR